MASLCLISTPASNGWSNSPANHFSVAAKFYSPSRGMTRIKNITGPMMQHILHGAVHLISMSWA
jgi:hypothetical protein